MQLYQGDCLEVMKQIPNKSIDMILCDLPYGTTACKWDTVIPFEPLWCEYNRIIKDIRDVENISVFYKKQCVYNPQFTKGEPYSALKGGKTSRVSESGATTYGKFMNGAEFRNDNSGFRYPKQVIEFGVVERGTVHPTQKPVPLLEYLINTYTNEGDTVLDNCMGSGSTGVAAKNLNRDFIGIELDKNYFEIAKSRILGNVE